MKLLVIFLQFYFSISTSSASLSFLENVFSEYIWQSNSSNPSQKSVFISQAIELNWIDSRRFCESNGLKLAKLSQDDVFGAEIVLQMRFQYENQKILFDGSDLEIDFSSNCSVIDTGEKNLEDGVKTVSCIDDEHKFICEAEIKKVDVVEVKVNNLEEKYDSLKFMRPLGVFTDNVTNETLKSYYMSDSDMKVTAAQATMFCQSIDMELASPQNEEEYQNLRNLLRLTLYEFDSLLIEAYRADSDDDICKSRGSPINYTMSFSDYDRNDQENGNCLIFYDNSIFMIDVPCNSHNQFICEKTKVSQVKEAKEKDLGRLVNTFSFFSHVTTKKTISKTLYLSQIAASWIDAQTICQSNGWSLFIPNSNLEMQMYQEKFKASKGLPSSFHVGLTEMGTGQMWYSIASGKYIDYDLNWVKNYDTDAINHCGKMTKVVGHYRFVKTRCNEEKLRFMCEKSFEDKYVNDKKNSDDEPEVVYYSIWKNFFEKEPPQLYENFLLPTPEPEKCQRKKDFFDSDGKYIKTACIVFEDNTYDESCVGNQMQLFILESPEMKKQLLEFATSIFGNARGSLLWINGNKLSDGHWYTFDPFRKSLPLEIFNTEESKVEIEIDYDIEDDNHVSRYNYRTYKFEERKCLVIQAINKFTVSEWNCKQLMYSVCEFKSSRKFEKAKKAFRSVSTTTDSPIRTPASTITPAPVTTPSSTTILPLTTASSSILSPVSQPASLNLLQKLSNLNKLNTKICNMTQAVFDDVGYEKSLCFVNETLSYDEASEKCRSNGMQLLLKNFELMNKIAAATENMFFESTQLIIDAWVHGKLYDVEISPDYKVNRSYKCYSLFYNSEVVDFFMDRCVNKKAFVCEY